MRTPSSKSRYSQIAAQIEADLAADNDTNRLPPLRTIARNYKVSIVTAARAVRLLEVRGLVKTIDRDGSYLVPRAPQTVDRWALCQRITPGWMQQASHAIVGRGFEELAAGSGAKVDHDLFHVTETATADEYAAQAQAARTRGVRGTFLVPSRVNDEWMRADERFLAGCSQAGMPVVLIERNLRGHDRPLGFDLVASDDIGGGAALTRHLFDLGRKRIAFVTGSPCSSHDDRMAGYLTALRRYGAGAQPIVFTQAAVPDAREAHRRLADEVISERVDGLICFQDYTALGLIIELLTRGVKVPADVAVAGFDDLPIGMTFTVGVTTHAFPSLEVARRAVEVMGARITHPNAPPVRMHVPGRVIVRESTVMRST